LVIDKTGASELEVQARFKKYLAHIKSYQKKSKIKPTGFHNADETTVLGEKRALPCVVVPPPKKQATVENGVSEVANTLSSVPSQLDEADELLNKNLSDSEQIDYWL